MKSNSFLNIICSILVAISLLFAYEYLLKNGDFGYSRAPVNQWDKNIILSQNYIYDNDVYDLVLVGSSLASRINNKWLNKHVYNLSMSGLSAADGLSVVLSSDKVPKFVLVETNTIDRGKNHALTLNLNDKLMGNARKYILEFNEKNRPLVVLYTSLFSYLNKIQILLNKNIASSLDASSKERYTDIYNKNLHRLQISYQKPINYTAGNIKTIKKLIDEVERRGSKVAFFEMPMDLSLCNSTKIKSIRKYFKEEYHGYPYIRASSCNGYATTDGHHLNYSSARKFAKGLFDSLRQVYW